MLPMPKMPYGEVVKCKCDVEKVDQAVQVPENGFLDDGQQYVGHDEAGSEIYDVSTQMGKNKLKTSSQMKLLTDSPALEVHLLLYTQQCNLVARMF